MRSHSAYATAGGSALVRQVAQRTVPPPRLLDLREREGASRIRALRYPAGDILVVSGLPGGGKSTLMRCGRGVSLIDSQDARLRWERRMPGRLPYPVYRPLVRIAHYAGLWRAVRSGASLIVHDCGTLPFVRDWLARQARRRGRGMHLLLLDVPEQAAREGQRTRGRGVSAYAMARHRTASGRLLAAVESGGPPDGCVSAVLLDRRAARTLETIAFDG